MNAKRDIANIKEDKLWQLGEKESEHNNRESKCT